MTNRTIFCPRRVLEQRSQLPLSRGAKLGLTDPFDAAVRRTRVAQQDSHAETGRISRTAVRYNL